MCSYCTWHSKGDIRLLRNSRGIACMTLPFQVIKLDKDFKPVMVLGEKLVPG